MLSWSAHCAESNDNGSCEQKETLVVRVQQRESDVTQSCLHPSLELGKSVVSTEVYLSQWGFIYLFIQVCNSCQVAQGNFQTRRLAYRSNYFVTLNMASTENPKCHEIVTHGLYTTFQSALSMAKYSTERTFHPMFCITLRMCENLNAKLSGFLLKLNHLLQLWHNSSAKLFF